MLTRCLYVGLLTLSVVATSAFAGHEVKNGGSVIICQDGDGSQHIYLLDFWEHRSEYHIKGLDGRVCYPGITCNGSAFEIASFYMQRLKHLDSDRYDRYMQAIGDFEWKMSEDLGPFSDLDDRGDVRTDPACVIKQAIIRYRNEDDGSILYKANPVIWNHISDLNRAGLIVHEVVYGEASTAGQTDSAKSRAFVAFLFSDEALTISPEQYRELIRTLEVPGD